jgi:hypothetical protein
MSPALSDVLISMRCRLAIWALGTLMCWWCFGACSTPEVEINIALLQNSASSCTQHGVWLHFALTTALTLTASCAA